MVNLGICKINTFQSFVNTSFCLPLYLYNAPAAKTKDTLAMTIPESNNVH